MCKLHLKSPWDEHLTREGATLTLSIYTHLYTFTKRRHVRARINRIIRARSAAYVYAHTLHKCSHLSARAANNKKDREDGVKFSLYIYIYRRRVWLCTAYRKLREVFKIVRPVTSLTKVSFWRKNVDKQLGKAIDQFFGIEKQNCRIGISLFEIAITSK